MNGAIVDSFITSFRASGFRSRATATDLAAIYLSVANQHTH